MGKEPAGLHTQGSGACVDYRLAAMGDGRRYLGKAQGLSWPLLARCSSWATPPSVGLVPKQKSGAALMSGTWCCWGSRTEAPGAAAL